MPSDLNTLANQLPADAMERLAAASAALIEAERKLGGVRISQLATLDATIAKLNRFATSLGNVSRLPTPNQQSAVSAQPSASHPSSPSSQPFATVVAKFASAVAKLDSAAGKLAQQQRQQKVNQQRGVQSPNPPGKSPGEKGPEFSDPGERGVAWSKIGDAIEGSFSRAISAVRGFTAVASPQHFNDLGASVNLLSLEIGTLFLPYIEYASRAIQTASRVLRGMSDTTKTTIARIALAAVAFGGVIVALRTLAGIIAVVRTTWLLASATMAATPIGAIAALVGVVGTLAAAWWGVNKAAQAAGQNQSAAGRGINAGAGNAEQTRVFSPEETKVLPEKYQKKLAELDAQRARAANDAARERVDTEYRALVTTMSNDLAAWVDSLPAKFRERLKKPDIKPDETRAVISDYLASLENELSDLRGNITPFAAEDKQTKRRNELLAGERETLRAEYKKREEAYYKRAGANALPPDIFGNFAPEFQGFREEVKAAKERIKAAGAKEGIDFTDKELGALRINPNGQGAGQVELTPLKPRDIGATVAEAAKTLTAKISVFQDVAKLIGVKPGDDPFLRSKPLVQSRFTDQFSYANDIQLAVLNQGDAEAELLKGQLENANKTLGDISGKLDELLNKQSESLGSSFLRGFIDLSR